MKPVFERIPLFAFGEGPYALYRIPGMVVTAGGSVLFCCEARHSTRGDWGPTDLLLRRSTDGGRTWSPPLRMNRSPEPVAPNPAAAPLRVHPGCDQGLGGDGQTCNNPVLIADRTAGRVHFLYCVEYARCFYRASLDDGQSWSEPVEITSALDELQGHYPHPQAAWQVCALGPGHGIQHTSGRLLVPVWLSPGTGGHAHRPSFVATIYSDDLGQTWRAGEIILANGPEFVNPSETNLVELSDGQVMASLRTESSFQRRVSARSPNGVRAWSSPQVETDLFEPVCFAGLARDEDGRILFSNPDSLSTAGPGRKRENLTVRLSEDDGHTWRAARVIDPGPAAYSDLAALPLEPQGSPLGGEHPAGTPAGTEGGLPLGGSGAWLCAYEGGGAHLSLVRFNLAWLCA